MTTQPAPDTIFNDLMVTAIDFLNGPAFTDLQVKRFERDIEKLANADLSGSFELRAHVAAARGQFEEADALFEKALSISNDYRGTIVRSLIVLGNTGQTRKVGDLFKRHREVLRSDPGAMRTIEGLLRYTGWVLTAIEVNQELARMGIQTEKTTGGGVDVEFAGIAEADIADVVGFTHRYLRNHSAKPSQVSTSAVPYEDGRVALLYQFSVDVAPEQLADLEWNLYGALEEAELTADTNRFVTVALSPKASITDAHIDR